VTQSSIASSPASPNASSLNSHSQENPLQSSGPITEPPGLFPHEPLTPIPSSSKYFTDGLEETQNAHAPHEKVYVQSMDNAHDPWNILPTSPMPVQESLSVPQRLLDGDEALRFIEQFQLPRHHRRIFFLLDGQRGIMDIVRLTRLPLQEIQQIL